MARFMCMGNGGAGVKKRWWGFLAFFIVTLAKVSQSSPTFARRRPMIGSCSNKQGVPMIRWPPQSKLCPRAKNLLFFVAICISSCAISGCFDSVWYLAGDSRLPKWFTLPPGLTRADVLVAEEAMEPTRRGVDIKIVLTDRKYRKLAEVHGKSFDLSGRYFIVVVDGVPEIIGLKTQKNKHGDDLPYFFVVDDPALKGKLLNENEKKLLDDNGIDYPALRKKLLDENGGAISDH